MWSGVVGYVMTSSCCDLNHQSHFETNFWVRFTLLNTVGLGFYSIKIYWHFQYIQRDFLKFVLIKKKKLLSFRHTQTSRIRLWISTVVTIKKHAIQHKHYILGDTNQNSFMAPSMHCGMNTLGAALSLYFFYSYYFNFYFVWLFSSLFGDVQSWSVF